MPNRPPVRRMVSPAGFLLALLCFGLPFVTVSCETPATTVSADYTGWDVAVGGEPDVDTSGAGGQVPSGGEIPVQALGVMALVVILGGIALTWPRQRTWPLSGVVLGCWAALLLFANQSVVRAVMVADLRKATDLPDAVVEGMVQSRVGYWATLVLVLGVAGYNVAEIILRWRTSRADAPEVTPVRTVPIRERPPP